MLYLKTSVPDREALEAIANGRHLFLWNELRVAAQRALSEIGGLRTENEALKGAKDRLAAEVATLNCHRVRNEQLVKDNAGLVEANATLRDKLEKLEADARVLVVDFIGVEQKAERLEEQLAAEKTKVLNQETNLVALRGSAQNIRQLEVELDEVKGKLRHAETRLTVVAGEKLKVERQLSHALAEARERVSCAESLQAKYHDALISVRELAREAIT